jgi:hypothetical protein
MHARGRWIMSILQDVLYVPDLSANLLSISHLACRGAEVHFISEACHVYDKTKSPILEGKLHNNLYIMQMHVDGPVTAKVATLASCPENASETPAQALTSSTGSLDLWHHCLGHLHTKAVTCMADEGLVTSMEISDREPRTQLCNPCLEGKQTHEVIHKTTSTRSKHMLGCIFTDVCGPLPTQSHRGYKYFVTFTDNKSCWVSISPLKEKSEVGQHLKAFIMRAELETGLKVKTLCSNGGGEYMAKHVQQFLTDRGIKHEITMVDMPQHNGIAECLNCTLLDKTRAMLSNADLPKSYWLEALNYAVLLHNVSPSKSLGTTPTEEYTGTKPDVSRLHVFGCMAHVHVPEQARGKLSACSMTCTFLGFAQQRSMFRLIHRPIQKFLESCNIVFNEGGPSPRHERIILEPNDDTPLPSPPPNPAAPSRPKRATCPPVQDDDPCYDVSSYGHRANIVLTDASEPKTYNKAMASPDAPKWLTACEEEMRTWKDLDVYNIVPQPKGRKVIGSKWVFHVKWGPNGSIQKHKARIVAQGFTQVEGINFDQTFTPVAKFSSL